MSNSPGPVSPDQSPSPEKKLPLVLALMMLVLLGWQYFFKPAPPPKPAVESKPPAAASAATPAQQQQAAAGAAAAAAVPAANAAQIQASGEITTDVDTNLFHIIFTNQGARIKSWVLKKYKDDEGKSLQLINPASSKLFLPFALDFPGEKPDFDANSVLYLPQVSNGGRKIEFEYSDGKFDIRKSFEFQTDSYLAEIKSSVVRQNTPIAHLLTWRGGFGDSKAYKAFSTERSVYYDSSAAKLITKVPKDAKDGPISQSGNFAFGGIEDNFFAAAALPADNTQLQVRTYSDGVKLPAETDPVQFVGAGLSTGPQNAFTLFVGPKDPHLLGQINPKLSSVLDWGRMGFIARPLYFSLNWVASHWTAGNYGWAIILVTIIINLALFPFRFTSLKSARKMQKLQPQLKAINDKYKNVKLNDPRKAQQNQEVMDLYKSEGVNPVGGCLPMLLQLPFFWAFYTVLNISIELRGAPWLWVSDLSQPETFFIRFLPVVMIATQFFSQKLTPAAGVDPNQQRMMMMMPLFLGFIFYSLSSGLVLYYLTGNLVGIAFQLVVNRFMPAPAPPPPPPAKAPVKSTVKK